MEAPDPPQSPNFGPPGPPVAAAPQTSGLAIASLVLGLLSLFFWVLTALPAVICGVLALRQIKRSQGAVSGSGMAIAGIATGSVFTVLLAGCVAALMIPAIGAAREAAQTNMSMNNMKQLALAMHVRHDSLRSFPATGSEDADSGSQLSWRVYMLPYLEGQDLYEQFNLDEPWDSENNLPLAEQMPEVFRAPNSRAAPNETVYLAVVGPGTLFGDGTSKASFREVVDGTSNTIMLVEADDSEAVVWTRPRDWEFDPNSPVRGLGGQRAIGWLAAFFDGHIDTIGDEVDPETIGALMTSSGRETVEEW